MNRYPGIRPFTSEDQLLFNGREQEKRELYQLVVLNDIVVLFGESGIGKTSLLQAGVCPDLEDRNLHPVMMRLNNTEVTPEVQVYQKLIENQYIPADLPPGLTLWEYLKEFWYVDLGEVFTPVIIFDQFEELFTLFSPEDRKEFVKQFADIVNGHMPDSIVSRLNDLPNKDLKVPPKLKIVISIRSDFLYLLDELSEDIPAILRTRFQLKPLDRISAIEAITLPAKMKGNFNSFGFVYGTNALENIIEELGKEEKGHIRTAKHRLEPEIEAFQLQLFCQYIENKIIEEKKEPGFVVQPEFYGAALGIRSIISEFYTNVLAKVEKTNRLNVEKLMAKGLIRNKRRIIMEEHVIKEEFELQQETLDLLHNQRLLKKEAQKGSLYYEISHDTLIEPILKKYKLIEEQEERERQERELLAKEHELKKIKAQAVEERQKRIKARWVAIVGFVLATVAIGALVFAIIQSEKLKQTGLILRRQAFTAELQVARNFKLERDFTAAFKQLSQAKILSNQLNQLERDQVKQFENQWKNFARLLAKGDSLSNNHNYRDALFQYRKAYQVSPDVVMEEQINTTEELLEKAFQELLKSAQVFSFSNKLRAIEKYEEALKLKPDDEIVKEKLEKIKN